MTLVDVLLDEIKTANQTKVGTLYAICFLRRDADPTRVLDVNKAIIQRWSLNGLERVKTIAWDVAHGLSKAQITKIDGLS